MANKHTCVTLRLARNDLLVAPLKIFFNMARRRRFDPVLISLSHDGAAALIEVIAIRRLKMVEAWYMDVSNDEVDKQKELHLDPPKFVDLDEMTKKTGVLYWKIDVGNLEKEGLFGKIREERGYNYEDIIEISREKLSDFDAKINMFYKEHFHADEEIRFVLEGSGYFDVRDLDDVWVRIHVTRGDLIVLPTGIHHRFTLDAANYVKVIRLFVGEPVWTAYNRPNDDHEARKKYLDLSTKGFLN